MNNKNEQTQNTPDRLEQARAEKKPSRKGVAECARVMDHMLKIGWDKSQLDQLEILFWKCRDRNGNVIQQTTQQP